MRLFTIPDFPPPVRRIAAQLVRCSPSSPRRSWLLILTALCALAPACAQDASTPAGYTVRGTVLNRLNGQPIPRAFVVLNEDQAVLTDGNGAFAFDNVAAGEYSVSVQKPGYEGFGTMMLGMMMRVSMGGGHRIATPPRRIQVGPDMPALAFRILPLAMITGHVTLSTADPPDGIQVLAYGRRYSNGRAQWVIDGRARTRSDGSFRIAGLDPGSYLLSTQASLDRNGPLAGRGGPVWGYPALYYPGVTDFAAAGTLTLAAGQQAEADFTLERQQFFPATVLVQNLPDTPASFEILDSGGRSTGLYAVWDRRDSLAHASVPNGTWSLEAHAYSKTQQWGSTTFQVNGAPVSFAINLVPVPGVPVVIHRDLASATDSSQPAPSGPGINLQLVATDEIGPGRDMGGGISPVEGSGDTQWELHVSQPGRYWIDAQAFPPAYISSITSGGVDLSSNPLIVAPGSSLAPIEVTLRNDSGTISGQISGQATGTSGSAQATGEEAQTWIYAIPLFSTAGEMRSVMPDQNGQFSFYNLAPGSYRVVACDAPQEIDFHSADGLAAWAGKGQTVTVDPGGTASVDLDILHGTAQGTAAIE